MPSGQIGFIPGGSGDPFQDSLNIPKSSSNASSGGRLIAPTFGEWLTERTKRRSGNKVRLNNGTWVDAGSAAAIAEGKSTKALDADGSWNRALAPGGGGGPGGGGYDQQSAAAAATAATGGKGATGDPQDGLAGAGGWAQAIGLNPAEAYTLYDEPWRAISLSMPDIAIGGAGYSALRNLPIDPLELRMMTEGAGGILAGSGQGAGDSEKEYGAAQYANFLNNFYMQMGTSGGEGINTANLLSNIFSQDTTQGPGKGESSLAQLLSSGDTSTQQRVMYNLIKSATEGGMDPLAAQAYQSAFLAAMDSYGASALTQDSETLPALNDYLAANFSNLTGGF